MYLRRIILQVLFFTGLFVFSTNVYASEIQELTAAYSNQTAATRYTIDRVICVDGLKIFQSIAFGYGSGSGADVSNIQLYEDKNGKAVPAQCKVEKKE